MMSSTRFPALAHRNFRLYIAGQGVSILGTWMQQVAMAWLVYQLTESPLWLGVVTFAGQIPCLFLGPVTGALIDRCQRHRLVIVTQAVAMLQALVLAALSLTGAVAVWHIVALGALLGVVNAFDIPGRQSFLGEIVPRQENLANAIALNSAVWNAARLVGPALAGLLLLVTNAGVCFLVNGLSYLAVLAALLAMRVPARQVRPPAGPVFGGVREGLAYAWNFRPIRSLLLLIALFQMAGMAQTTLLPVIATAVVGGDASTLGLLAAAGGLGSLTAAVSLAARRSVQGLGRWIAASTVVFGGALVAISFARSVGPAALLLSAIGFSLLLLTAGANTIMQTLVAEDKRGRILGLYTMAVTGLSPLGGLLAGVLADQVGAPITLRLAGLGCLATLIAFAVRLPRLARRSWSPCAVLSTVVGTRPAA
jgi:MFS family permease